MTIDFETTSCHVEVQTDGTALIICTVDGEDAKGRDAVAFCPNPEFAAAFAQLWNNHVDKLKEEAAT